jgi:hypothetical protein
MTTAATAIMASTTMPPIRTLFRRHQRGLGADGRPRAGVVGLN